MGYIGSHGVAALHRYKYSGVDHSYLAKYVLQPFWTRFVNFFPLWMPPNMITLMGFMFLLLSALLGYIYSPHLDSAPPRWVHFAHGLLLFLYQTFDAVDGKQARRTNSSSPLGELFDHGCDALACTFEALAFGSTSMCGRSTFWWWLISAVTFYGATWEHYFTNTLILPVVNGPTEGLMLIYLSHFFTAVVGAEWWAQQFGKSLPFLNWLPFIADVPTYSAILCLMIAFGVIPTVTFNVLNVAKVVKSKNGSMPLALAMLYPFVVLVGGVLVWDYLSPSDIIANYPHLVVMGTGLTFGYLVGRMILAHLCDEPKGLKTGMCMSLLYLPFAIANALASKLNDGVPLVNERLVLLGYCAFTASLYLHFATSVIHEITDALGIYCFRITRKEA
ncbi:choline/ethanolaminephosphotransferase 1 [Cicer arietinum]|uniref:Choline/ethanolaminephosphotransferase 1 n=1 Tax=Cicer arietinum TaxID=3827 RepID=A0A1S2XHQ0_CICAR|nr:choline/ethanolaminephosphotransferase 1 [Cicer arietinum]XP_004487396.1 choline/ethanolaminephosphotransferase 1 [Cicer arietinum]XP_004487397.1 choline/ethanolaminephosphotransferase 1 [Cicer arietinum]XP_004487398.1 choline/ethanolaminephosphotransferase 1 [Cicer arietinum]XP_004489540.1 choline/ethanolaminephosphotransferase 1 [Cicer arietinum]XP_004489541.1 choline/ethanolaminephosphotransferase 1 [Cicer arietinum]XP_004489542.1 choline/ethanolaminephosphotransferase 1 [Cicer arietinu